MRFNLETRPPPHASILATHHSQRRIGRTRLARAPGASSAVASCSRSVRERKDSLRTSETSTGSILWESVCPVQFRGRGRGVGIRPRIQRQAMADRGQAFLRVDGDSASTQSCGWQHIAASCTRFLNPGRLYVAECGREHTAQVLAEATARGLKALAPCHHPPSHAAFRLRIIQEARPAS
jgi:hypothetical protein